MTDPFPPKIIIEHHNGEQTFCHLKDVVDGVPRYELPCPDCGGAGELYSGNPEEATRLEADTARALDLIGKAFGS